MKLNKESAVFYENHITAIYKKALSLRAMLDENDTIQSFYWSESIAPANREDIYTKALMSADDIIFAIKILAAKFGVKLPKKVAVVIPDLATEQDEDEILLIASYFWGEHYSFGTEMDKYAIAFNRAVVRDIEVGEHNAPLANSIKQMYRSISENCCQITRSLIGRLLPATGVVRTLPTKKEVRELVKKEGNVIE